MKEIIKRIIVSNQENIRQLKLISRKISIEPNGNYVITGPRRAGKTYFLYQLIQEYCKSSEKYSEILYINFEDERLMELHTSDLQLILDGYYEMFSTRPKIFFDEIQNIDNWHKFVRRLADENYNIIITGSNAKMLSKDILTTLGGRFIVKEIMPLSFNEFLYFNQFIPDKNTEYSNDLYTLKKLYFDYIQNGGFPEALKFSNKKEYLSNLFQKLLYSDVIVRNKIKNDIALKLLVKKMAESVNSEISFTHLKNIIKSIGFNVGTSTLIEYFEYLNHAFLIFSISNFKSKFVERESKKKFYFVDNGILNLFLIDQPTKLLENFVFLELMRMNKDKLFYIKRNNETDFYLPEQNELIQVSYNIDSYETKKREINALIASLKKLDLKTGTILTFDQSEEIVLNGYKIKVMPAWKKFL